MFSFTYFFSRVLIYVENIEIGYKKNNECETFRNSSGFDFNALNLISFTDLPKLQSLTKNDYKSRKLFSLKEKNTIGKICLILVLMC